MGTQKDLFDGDTGEVFVKRSKRQVFEDYDAFVAKFNKELPKNTDDCYTPQAVYEAVLSWLKQNVDIDGRSIVRPFYPGGDYKNEVYPENCVVVDNPPFSILSEIVRFYLAAKIDFFLFAPGLTLMTPVASYCTAIVTASSIRYANGAEVCTGFLSSLFDDTRIIVSTTLHEAINKAQNRKLTVKRTKREYPKNLVTSALLTAVVGGGDFIIKQEDCYYIRDLDDLRRKGECLFGGGYLLSSRMAAVLAEGKVKNEVKLSQRELNIIKQLDAKDNSNDNCT